MAYWEWFMDGLGEFETPVHISTVEFQFNAMYALLYGHKIIDYTYYNYLVYELSINYLWCFVSKNNFLRMKTSLRLIVIAGFSSAVSAYTSHRSYHHRILLRKHVVIIYWYDRICLMSKSGKWFWSTMPFLINSIHTSFHNTNCCSFTVWCIRSEIKCLK